MTAMPPAPVGVLPDLALQIGDQAVADASGGVHQHVYPATGEVTAMVTLAGPAEIDRAVTAARTALSGWRAMPADQRRNLLAEMGRLVAANVEKLSY